MRNVQVIQGLPFNVVKPFIDITDKLPSRPDPESPRTPDQITHISVHHSAVEGQGPYQYADWHVNHNKWSHIGYHMVVHGEQTYQTNDLLTFSYHTSSHNSYTVSVSVSGDFTKREMSEVERNNLYAAILTLMDIFNIPVQNVWAHHEFPGNSTSCPGFSIEKVRKDIQTLKNQMSYKQSAGNKKAVAFEIANQILYLANMGQGKNADGTETDPGNREWALNVLMELKPFMQQRGLL